MTDVIPRPRADGLPAEGAAAVTVARLRGAGPARWTWGQLGLLVVLAVIVLFTVPNPSLAIGMLIFGLWASGLNLLVGYGGLVSFGHALPFAYGGYAAGLMLLHVSTSAWLRCSSPRSPWRSSPWSSVPSACAAPRSTSRC